MALKILYLYLDKVLLLITTYKSSHSEHYKQIRMAVTFRMFELSGHCSSGQGHLSNFSLGFRLWQACHGNSYGHFAPKNVKIICAQ